MRQPHLVVKLRLNGNTSVILENPFAHNHTMFEFMAMCQVIFHIQLN